MLRDMAAYIAGCLVGFAAAAGILIAISGDSPLLALLIGVPLICGGGGVALAAFGDQPHALRRYTR